MERWFQKQGYYIILMIGGMNCGLIVEIAWLKNPAHLSRISSISLFPLDVSSMRVSIFLLLSLPTLY